MSVLLPSPTPSFDSVAFFSASQKSALQERTLGNTEASYFLPSREDGVNDMYLHIGFRAPSHTASYSRLRVIWAILRIQHPLLASSVKMNDYHDIRFQYTLPITIEDALNDADKSLECCTLNKDELLDSYLNGPRTLSNERLSCLIFSQDTSVVLPTPPQTPRVDDNNVFEKPLSTNLMLCTTHFLGDGMALHNTANELFILLGSSRSESELLCMLEDELSIRAENGSVLPECLENRLPAVTGRFQRVAGRVEFLNWQKKDIGGHSFPRKFGTARRTIVPTVSVDEDRTKAILKKCKANGVSISSAIFALCNLAWARTSPGLKDMPVMMYSALNLRPHLSPARPLEDSIWFIAIGYFNIVLPHFLPSRHAEVVRTFWHRAQRVKEESRRAAKSMFIVSRTLEMARERGDRARKWAKEDDEKAPKVPSNVDSAKAPSTALMGLSLLGNLDGIYKHDSFGRVELHTLMTGSRQRSGGLLLFGYTFVGKLWLSLGYDVNGFDKTVLETFWKHVLDAVDEML